MKRSRNSDDIIETKTNVNFNYLINNLINKSFLYTTFLYFLSLKLIPEIFYKYIIIYIYMHICTRKQMK